MKAQKMFGGTKPMDHSVKSKCMDCTGGVKNFTGKIAPKVTVKQVGTKGRLNG